MSKKLYHLRVVIEGVIDVEAESPVEAKQLTEEKVQDSFIGDSLASSLDIDYIDVEIEDTEDLEED